MMRNLGKKLPPALKRPLIRLYHAPSRIHARLFQAAAHGKIPCPDKLYLKWHYRVFTGRKLNLKNPVLYQEKLQWLKYYYRNPAYTQLVDKYGVRSFVKERIGEEYLVPIYGVYNSFDEIDFDQLPDQFVLKCTHDSGSVVICTDQARFDKAAAKKKLTEALHRNQFYLSREWYYKNVTPRIICEKYLQSDSETGFIDYKFMCFHGEVKFLYTCTNRFVQERINENFFDLSWKPLPFCQEGYAADKREISPPQNFEKMKRFAALLSADIPHVRVDFFEVQGKLYFSEMTFFDSRGTTFFVPEQYNKIIGDDITLPPIYR